MKPTPTNSRDDRSPGSSGSGAGGPGTAPVARPKVILVVLAAGLLSVLVMFLARSGAPASSRRDAGAPASAGILPASSWTTPASSAVPQPIRAIVDTRGPVESVAPDSPLSIPDHWGIEITKVGVAAGGKALDLRYKVIDVAKATSLLYLTNFVYILNQSSGKALHVPFQRENQTSQKLVAGKTYFTLLPNKEGRVQSGSMVTVVLGGSRAENLVVN